MPLAIVVDELFDVRGFVKLAQQKVVQDGVVQNHYAGTFQCAAVYGAVQGVIPQVIERHIAARRRDLHASMAAQLRQKSRGVIRHAGARGGRGE